MLSLRPQEVVEIKVLGHKVLWRLLRLGLLRCHLAADGLLREQGLAGGVGGALSLLHHQLLLLLLPHLLLLLLLKMNVL